MLVYDKMLERAETIDKIAHTLELFILTKETVFASSVKDDQERKQFLGIEDILQTKLEHVQIACSLFKDFMNHGQEISLALKDFNSTDILDYFVSNIVESTLSVYNCILELSKLHKGKGVFSYLEKAKTAKQFMVRHKTSHPDPKSFVNGAIEGGKSKFRVNPYVSKEEPRFISENDIHAEITIEYELEQMLDFYCRILSQFEEFLKARESHD